jgi:hypothetical protein
LGEQRLSRSTSHLWIEGTVAARAFDPALTMKPSGVSAPLPTALGPER